MAEQGRYDRDGARGGDYDDDGRSAVRPRGRGGDDSGGGRGDRLFGSGWSEREERGWGSSGVNDRSDDRDLERGRSGGGSWFGGGQSRSAGERSSTASRGRDGGGSRSGSWFGGSGSSSRERDHRGRERDWEPVEVPPRGDERERIERERMEAGRIEAERIERDRLEDERRQRARAERGRSDRDWRGEDDDRERIERERGSPSRGHGYAEHDGRRDEHRDRDGDGIRDDREGHKRGGIAAAAGLGAAGVARGRSDRDRSDRDDLNRGERGFGPDDQHGGMPIDETDRLIASNKVEGTAVYGLDGDRLGSIYNFMVEKVAGKVEYAVMTYGGFLGMGTRYFPIPWQLLKYDTRRGGYRVDLTTRDLERAPSFDRSSEPEFDREYGRRVHNWYGLNY